jgi:hypothetical protein
MINKPRGEVAYTIIDTGAPISDEMPRRSRRWTPSCASASFAEPAFGLTNSRGFAMLTAAIRGCFSARKQAERSQNTT